MGRLIAAAVLAALPAAPAIAQAAALDQIRARLDAHAVVRAEFVQTRTMAALQRPQVSRGQLLVSRSEGAVWRMVEPYSVTYVLRQDSVVEIAADGTRTRRNAQEAPAVAWIGRIMSALVMADAAVLGNDFGIDATIAGDRWHIALTPRQASIAQRLRAVRINGREFVDSVEVEETSGDATQLQFRNHRGAATLSGDERRLFAVE